MTRGDPILFSNFNSKILLDIYPKNLMKNLKDNNNQLHLLQQNKANKNANQDPREYQVG